MSEAKHGGSAFPQAVAIGGPGDAPTFSNDLQDGGGLTKREYYAAAALQGWLARYTPDKGVPDIGHTADFCFRMAEAMVKRSEQT